MTQKVSQSQALGCQPGKARLRSPPRRAPGGRRWLRAPPRAAGSPSPSPVPEQEPPRRGSGSSVTGRGSFLEQPFPRRGRRRFLSLEFAPAAPISPGPAESSDRQGCALRMSKEIRNCPGGERRRGGLSRGEAQRPGAQQRTPSAAASQRAELVTGFASALTHAGAQLLKGTLSLRFSFSSGCFFPSPPFFFF